MTLEGICKELKNWFTKDDDKHFGTFMIADGIISPVGFLVKNQYFRIVGSIFNDGVYQYQGEGIPVDGLIDETFSDGAVWAMSGAVFKVAAGLDELNTWIDANKETLQSPYTSESFGGYSYTKASGNTSNASDGNVQLTQKINELL